MDEKDLVYKDLLERVSAEYNDEATVEEGLIPASLIDDINRELETAIITDSVVLKLLSRVIDAYDEDDHEGCGVIPQDLMYEIRSALGRCEGCGLKKMVCVCQLRD